MSLVKPQPIDPRATRGPRTTLGTAADAGFNLARPGVGFGPDLRVEKQIYAPVEDFLTQQVQRSNLGGFLRNEPQQPTLSQDMVDRLRSQKYRPDSQTTKDLVAELDSKGIQYPDALNPANMEKRRTEILSALERDRIRNEEVLSRASPGTAVFGSVIGGIGAEFTDPVNVMASVVGAPARVGWLATIGIEAGINAAINVAQTPGRNRLNEQIGGPRESMLSSAAIGALFGGVFGGAVKGTGIVAPKAWSAGTQGLERIGKMIGRVAPVRDMARIGSQAEDGATRFLADTILKDIAEQDRAVTNPAPDTIREHLNRSQAATDSATSGQPLDIPDRPVTAAPQRSIINGQIEEINPSDLKVQPERFQFKSEATGPEGVTPKLQGVQEWRPERAGVVVVYEYADGTRAIADGHQRVALANRVMRSNPDQKVVLAGRVYRESDGFSVDDVRVLAAIKNITEAADGMTARMAKDAAKVLRVDPKMLEQLPAGPGVARAQSLSKLSDDAFSLYINDVVPEQYAELVGKLVDDPKLHGAVMRLLERVQPETRAQAESVIQQAMAAPKRDVTTKDLFGENTTTESLFLERAKVLERSMKMLREDRSVFKTITDQASRIEGTGSNALDKATNEEIRKSVEKALAAIKSQAHRAGPISEALNNGAKKYAETGRLKDAAAGVADAVRGEVQRNGFPGTRTGGAGRVSESADPGAGAPDPNEGFADPVTGDAVQAQIDNTRIDAPDQGAADLADQVPVGITKDADGNDIAQTVTRSELAAELDADDNAVTVLETCIK